MFWTLCKNGKRQNRRFCQQLPGLGGIGYIHFQVDSQSLMAMRWLPTLHRRILHILSGDPAPDEELTSKVQVKS